MCFCVLNLPSPVTGLSWALTACSARHQYLDLLDHQAKGFILVHSRPQHQDQYCGVGRLLLGLTYRSRTLTYVMESRFLIPKYLWVTCTKVQLLLLSQKTLRSYTFTSPDAMLQRDLLNCRPAWTPSISALQGIAGYIALPQPSLFAGTYLNHAAT